MSKYQIGKEDSLESEALKSFIKTVEFNSRISQHHLARDPLNTLIQDEGHM